MNQASSSAAVDQQAEIDAMASRLGVDGDFVRVPQLAKALGISSTSIHAQMRRGTFPMPHRRVGNVIVVKLVDYVRWFHDEPRRVVAPEPPAASHATAAAEHEPEREDAGARGSSRAGTESRAEFKARLKREVLESMRRDGFKV